MKTAMLKAISAASLSFTLALALPGPNGRKLEARQDINFTLVDSTPDPTIRPDDTSNFNSSAAIASVVAAVTASPETQSKRSLEARDMLVNSYPGYTDNVPIGKAAMYAPLDCNKHETYMGAKLFTSTAFDTALCAAACTAQSAYNLRHPPPNGPAQTCQFYNTYALYKNDIYQGQYCTLYNQTWNATYATNTGQYRGSDHYTIQYSYIASNATNPGQCPQAATKTPLDLSNATTNSYLSMPEVQIRAEKNLLTLRVGHPQHGYYYVSATIQFPVIANQIYEITFDFFQEGSLIGEDQIEIGDDNGSEAYVYWRRDAAGSPTTRHINKSFLNDETAVCFKEKAVPQTTPVLGIWNTGKVILTPRTSLGYFRWYLANELGENGLQLKNLYVTKLPADYCSSGK